MPVIEYEMEGNGTLCRANNTIDLMDLNQTLFSCFIIDHDGKQIIILMDKPVVVPVVSAMRTIMKVA